MSINTVEDIVITKPPIRSKTINTFIVNPVKELHILVGALPSLQSPASVLSLSKIKKRVKLEIKITKKAKIIVAEPLNPLCIWITYRAS